MASLGDPMDRIDEAGRLVLEELEDRRGRVDMYRAMALGPEILERVGSLGTYLRFGSGAIDDLERELAITRAARRMGSPYEWVMHAPLLREAGMAEQTIAAIGRGETPDELTPSQRDVVALTDHVVARESVPRDLHDRIVERHGEAGFVELTVLVGFYGMIAAFIAAVEIPLPEGAQAPFPPASSTDPEAAGEP